MEMDLEMLEMETGIQSIQNIEMCGRRSMVKLGDFGEVCCFMSKKSDEFCNCGG